MTINDVVAVLDRYELQRPYTFRSFNRGINLTYLVRSGNRRFFLRISRPGWRTVSQVKMEIDLLEALEQDGFRVPRGVRAKDGDVVSTLRKSDRCAVLFKDLAGEPLRLEGSMCELAGETLARIHGWMPRDDPRLRERPTLDAEQLITEPLQRLKEVVPSPELRQLETVGLRLTALLQSMEDDGSLQQGLCHGDLETSNMRRVDTDEFALLDFDCCGPGWQVFDLATFLWSRLRAQQWDVPLSAERAKEWRRFMVGYERVRPLDERERELLGLLVLARHFWFLGLPWRFSPPLISRDHDPSAMARPLKFATQWITMRHLDVAIVRTLVG